MAEQKKKEEGSSWDFKIDQKAEQEANKQTSAASRLKEQSQKAKSSSIKNIKVEAKKQTISRTQLAALEAQKSKFMGSACPPELRKKAAYIDLAVCGVLYFISTQLKSFVGLQLVALSKQHDFSHHLEKVADSIEKIVTWSVFLLLYGLVMFLPTLFSARTPGKWVTHTIIEDEEGGYPSKGTLLLRESVGKLINIISVVGLHFTFNDKKGKGLHDRMFHTVVNYLKQ